MENVDVGHVAKVKGDKCLLADVPCLCIGSKITPNGHEFSDRRVFFYPDEVYVGRKSKRHKIYFVPAIPFNTTKPERVPLPIYMLELSNYHKREIIVCGVENGLNIQDKDFVKLQIATSPDFYDQELSFDEEEDLWN